MSILENDRDFNRTKETYQVARADFIMMLKERRNDVQNRKALVKEQVGELNIELSGLDDELFNINLRLKKFDKEEQEIDVV